MAIVAVDDSNYTLIRQTHPEIRSIVCFLRKVPSRLAVRSTMTDSRSCYGSKGELSWVTSRQEVRGRAGAWWLPVAGLPRTQVTWGRGLVKTDETVASRPLFVAFVNDSTWQFDAGLPCLVRKWLLNWNGRSAVNRLSQWMRSVAIRRGMIWSSKLYKCLSTLRYWWWRPGGRGC